MIKALIVDDEKKAIVVLRRLLNEYCPDISIVAEADRVPPAMQLIDKHKPQLIFLDIEMPGKSGFDLLEKIGEHNFHVIFITAHSEFALKAFRFSVVDYLLKPVAIDELKQAVEKVKIRIDNFSGEKELNKVPIQTLRIPTTEGVVFVYIEHVIRAEAKGAYSHIYLDDGKSYLISDHLKILDEYLVPPMFMRIHRSHIINLSKIKSVMRKEGLFAEMSDGSVIEVSKRNRADFIKVIHK